MNDGERRLAADVVSEALCDADRPHSTDARDWLRDGAALYSARVCIEALGFDYRGAVERLEARWRQIDRGETVPPLTLEVLRCGDN